MENVGNDLQEILNKFEQVIMEKADAQCEDIHQEMEAYRSSELAKYKDDARVDYHQRLESGINEISTDSAEELALKKSALKKELFHKRSAYCEEVFAAVKDKLLSFTDSGKYQGYLEKKAEKIAALELDETPTLLVREKDLALSESIQAAYGAPCQVQASEEIAIGGIIALCQSTGYRIDETLDAALENQKDWFFENSGMYLTV